MERTQFSDAMEALLISLSMVIVAVNSKLMHRVMNTELEIGLLLPCNVIVYEEDGGSVVSIVDPIAMLSVVENPALNPVAQEARTRLQRVINALSN